MEKTQKSRFQIITEQIKQDIKDGKLTRGQQLPSEKQFAQTLNVSRATLREALRILEEENIVTRKHGVGTFINQQPVFKSGIEELQSMTNMIKSENKQPGTEVLSSKYVYADADDCKNLQMAQNDRVLRIKRVRTADGHPLVYCIDKIPEHLLHRENHLLGGSLFSFLEEQNIMISYAKADIQTISYDEEISTSLQCGADTPLLILQQLHYSVNDQPVLHSTNYFRSDRFSFSVLRKRSGISF